MGEVGFKSQSHTEFVQPRKLFGPIPLIANTSKTIYFVKDRNWNTEVVFFYEKQFKILYVLEQLECEENHHQNRCFISTAKSLFKLIPNNIIVTELDQ